VCIGRVVKGGERKRRGRAGSGDRVRQRKRTLSRTLQALSHQSSLAAGEKGVEAANIQCGVKNFRDSESDRPFRANLD
jgi:hypothetical protein